MQDRSVEVQYASQLRWRMAVMAKTCCGLHTCDVVIEQLSRCPCPRRGVGFLVLTTVLRERCQNETIDQVCSHVCLCRNRSPNGNNGSKAAQEIEECVEQDTTAEVVI